ncbi:hypothetical protein AB0N05_14930 [Nocardia sp. NPDC051030]|uniref:hypothetical protein n=1 Tax=Nocardia sp. NPDC051030 TaxID=3155162 RepID=UPI00341A507E
MSEFVCDECWRRDNLTFAQRLDPAFIRPGRRRVCEEHRARDGALHIRTRCARKPKEDDSQQDWGNENAA